jgi:hypothetical protein
VREKAATEKNFEWHHLHAECERFTESWTTFFEERPVCYFFRDLERDAEWCIEGESKQGAHFQVWVPHLQLIEDVRSEAEFLMISFGWGRAYA